MEQKKHHKPKSKQNKPTFHLNKEQIEENRQEFINVIRRKCSFNYDVNLLHSKPESGYAKKKFLIFRTHGNPWVVNKGHLLDWSNEKFLVIQQIKHSDSKILEEANKGENWFEKFIFGLERAMQEQGVKEINKMFTKSFDIQWKNIKEIGD
jgi:hypothetical protein